MYQTQTTVAPQHSNQHPHQHLADHGQYHNQHSHHNAHHQQPNGHVNGHHHPPNGQHHPSHSTTHHQHSHPQPHNQPHVQQSQQAPTQAPAPRSRQPTALPQFNRVQVQGIPSVLYENDQVLVGEGDSTSMRDYTPIKVVGDGSFGTVWLVDWHGPLPPNTPLSAMQRNAGARPEYANKCLVAVKRMKRQWSGWDECRKLKELESLRTIPYHPNVIPLYDFFLLPDTKELYFVFESMEGNLYQLIKSRRNRPLAGGLVASIFQQVIHGLHHIHAAGYFHRDMKPENLLVTTTGLFDYPTLNPHAPPGSPPERDVVVIVKIADFGLARETKSAPPYTEYVSTRWYRAPEVLLRSQAYSNPVDMWAFGAIMAELVDLRPLFPGNDEMDQVVRICQILGDPSDAYGKDQRGKPFGGGKWDKGHSLAARVGCQFPQHNPVDMFARFHHSVPVRLVECIVDLLRYDPSQRLTSQQCLEHAYLRDALRHGGPPSGLPQTLRASASEPNVNRLLNMTDAPPVPPLPTIITRAPPPSHAHSTEKRPFNEGTSTNPTSLYSPAIEMSATLSEQSSVFNLGQPSAGSWPASTSMPNIGEPMEISPAVGDSPQTRVPVPDATSPMVQDEPTGPLPPAKPGKFSFGKKTSKWSLGLFGHHDKHLPSVDEMPTAITPSKRAQTSDSGQSADSMLPKDAKAQRKEAERIRLEAERERRALAERTAKAQARAVMEKKKQADWEGNLLQAHNVVGRLQPSNMGQAAPTASQASLAPGREAASGVIRQHHHSNGVDTRTAAGARYMSPPPHGHSNHGANGWRDPLDGRMAKVARRDWGDLESMSSSDVHSVSRMSAISFATIDSDPGPGPTRLRHRPSLLSTSSLRTSFDTAADGNSLMGPPSIRSASSLQYEQQLAEDFIQRTQLGSPPPMNLLSLSPNTRPWVSPGLTATDHSPTSPESARHGPPHLTLPPPRNLSGRRSSSPYNLPSPGFAPKSAINPIFRVPAENADHTMAQTHTLPPFSQLEAVAEGEYPPLSPMSFYRPDEDEATTTT